MAYDNPNRQSGDRDRDSRTESLYSKRIKAGKRRTYFFDVRETRASDYFITITESKKRFDDGGYDRHKMFLYKEDFNKFLLALTDTINYVKTDLMPNFDFDAFNHDNDEEWVPNHSGVEAETKTYADSPVYAEAMHSPAVEPLATIPAETLLMATEAPLDIEEWKI